MHWLSCQLPAYCAHACHWHLTAWLALPLPLLQAQLASLAAAPAGRGRRGALRPAHLLRPTGARLHRWGEFASGLFGVGGEGMWACATRVQLADRMIGAGLSLPPRSCPAGPDAGQRGARAAGGRLCGSCACQGCTGSAERSGMAAASWRGIQHAPPPAPLPQAAPATRHAPGPPFRPQKPIPRTPSPTCRPWAPTVPRCAPPRSSPPWSSPPTWATAARTTPMLSSARGGAASPRLWAGFTAAERAAWEMRKGTRRRRRRPARPSPTPCACRVSGGRPEWQCQPLY